MKFIYFLLFSVIIFSSSSFAQTKNLVLIELFTSEACPTCPPADDTLLSLENSQPVKDVEIVPLALHVDYWNSNGWQDKYSSPLFSRRQEIYSRVFRLGGTFTPQMVVDGAAQFVGSRLAEATKKIAEATKFEKAKFDLKLSGDQLNASVKDLPKHENSTVFLAVTENNLPNNLVVAKNSGQAKPHPPTVRQMLPLGSVAANADSFQTETFLQLQPEWKRENLNFVVFAQDNVTRRVIALGQIK